MNGTDKAKCLNVSALGVHLSECGIGIITQGVTTPHLPVVIRTEFGDYAVAAVHRDEDRLIFDLGVKLAS